MTTLKPHLPRCSSVIVGVICAALKTGCAVYIPVQTGPIHDGKTLGANGSEGQVSYSKVVTYRYDLLAVAWYAIPDPQIGVTTTDDILMSAAARYGMIDGIDVGAETHTNISSAGGQVFLKMRIHERVSPLSVAGVFSLGYDKGSVSGGEGTKYAESSTRLRAHAVQFTGGVPLSYDVSPHAVLTGAAFLHYSNLEASGEFASSDKFGSYSGKRYVSTRITALSYTLGFNVIGLGVFVRWYDREKPQWGISLGSGLYSYFGD